MTIALDEINVVAAHCSQSKHLVYDLKMRECFFVFLMDPAASNVEETK